MSVRKDEVQRDVDRLTEADCRCALSCLIGMDVHAVQLAVEYVQEAYPAEVTQTGREHVKSHTHDSLDDIDEVVAQITDEHIEARLRETLRIHRETLATRNTEENDVYGQNHRYCRTCGHAVRYGHPRCGGCGTAFTELMLLDLAFDRGYARQGLVDFDPLDGQFAFSIGDGFAVEADGQLDVETPLGAIPIQDDPFTDPFGW